MTYTLLLIIITAVVSVSAFNNNTLYNNLILWPKRMHEPKEYYRLLTSGFIHADWQHLIFNMLTLYFFGRNLEYITSLLNKHVLFIFLYLTAIIVSSLPSFLKNKNNGYYRSLGASGGVAAVLFSVIYYSPWQKIYIWFLPIPGILAAGAYLFYSAYMSRRGADNINHDAHFWGAVYGFVFAFAIDPMHGKTFLQQISFGALG